MRKFMFAMLVALPLAVSACNTIAGVGKDVKTVGGVLEETAEDAK